MPRSSDLNTSLASFFFLFSCHVISRPDLTTRSPWQHAVKLSLSRLLLLACRRLSAAAMSGFNIDVILSVLIGDCLPWIPSPAGPWAFTVSHCITKPHSLSWDEWSSVLLWCFIPGFQPRPFTDATVASQRKTEDEKPRLSRLMFQSSHPADCLSSAGVVGLRHHRPGSASGRTPSGAPDQPEQHPSRRPGPPSCAGPAWHQGHPWWGEQQQQQQHGLRLFGQGWRSCCPELLQHTACCSWGLLCSCCLPSCFTLSAVCQSVFEVVDLDQDVVMFVSQRQFIVL